MSINAQQLRTLIIRPVLQNLNLWSEAAENLLMGTAAQESGLGTYIKQNPGPALGIYQIEPSTYQDCWDNYLKYKGILANKIRGYCANPSAEAMVYNLAFATCMARVKYLRSPEKLPEANDLPALAKFYKLWYNTPAGKATEQQFIDNYKRYVQ